MMDGVPNDQKVILAALAAYVVVWVVVSAVLFFRRGGGIEVLEEYGDEAPHIENTNLSAESEKEQEEWA